MARHLYTYRFKISATNEGYEHIQKWNRRHIRDVIYTYSQKIENIVECDNKSFVIKRDVKFFCSPINLKNNKDVLCHQLQESIFNYLLKMRFKKLDTCIFEYELLCENTFSTNEYISDKLRNDVRFMVNAIKAIGDNTLINPIEQIKAMRFEIPLNYVSSEIFSILNKRATSDSPKLAREYLGKFIAAFFRLIPNEVIEKYDTLYEKREKERIKNAGYKQSDDSPKESKNNDEEAIALVSELIKYDLIKEINNIIDCVYKGQKFCFESFASWKKAIINFLEIDESSIKYEDSKTQSSILNEISNERYKEQVKEYLRIIDKHYHIRDIHREAKGSAIFYKFLTICPSKFLNDKYKRKVGTVAKEFKRSEFKNLCLQYFGLEPNQMRPNKCEEAITKLNSDEDNREVWYIIKPPKKPK